MPARAAAVALESKDIINYSVCNSANSMQLLSTNDSRDGDSYILETEDPILSEQDNYYSNLLQATSSPGRDSTICPELRTYVAMENAIHLQTNGNSYKRYLAIH